MKKREYEIEITYANPKLVEMANIMKHMDLGIDGLCYKQIWKITTTTKWTKKVIEKFRKYTKKEGWEIYDFKLKEIV